MFDEREYLKLRDAGDCASNPGDFLISIESNLVNAAKIRCATKGYSTCVQVGVATREQVWLFLGNDPDAHKNPNGCETTVYVQGH
jgi:hypothetical protein